MSSISIEPGRADDLPAIESLLSSNRLPTAGLAQALDSSVVAREGGRILGCAAVEVYGPAGLLRSVCVLESLRGSGLGTRLVEEAEAIARRRGVVELFLLTETAAAWFPRLGYVPDSREAVPASLRESAEFKGACPDSARLLRKRLHDS